MKKPFLRDRKTRYGGITVLLTVLIIAVTVLANAVFGTLAKRYTWYSFMVSEGTYDVSSACFSLLDNAFEKTPDAKVKLVFCSLPNAKGEMDDSTLNYVYHTAKMLKERYPDRIEIACEDIWTNPGSVRKYKQMVNPITGEDVEINIKSTSVIIVSDDFHRTYDLTEFFVFENGDTSKVWAYDGEKKLSAGMIRAISDEERVVCLTDNHGEIFYDYELVYLLDDAGYTITYLDLHKDPIPANCDLIISSNPNSDLVSDTVSAKSEIDILEEFLAVEGNSFLVLLENGTPSLPNFEKFLAGWGVELSYYEDRESGFRYRYMVQDTANSLTSDGYTIYGQAVTTGHSAELTEGLIRPIIFKNATALAPAQGFVNKGDGSYTSGDRTLYSLYTSSNSAYCWANGKTVAGGGAMLMTLTEQKTAKGSSFVGVIASADFGQEEFLQSAVYGNTDLMMRTFETMGNDLTTEGLSIKPFSSTTISTITTAQMLRWTLSLSLIPAAVITLTAIILLVRRRRA